MAGLCTGISYGLSQSSLHENKELIFVKLTDSAYRAIEEYQKNKVKFSTHPTIQFSGNEGFMSFPSVASSLGQKFSFSISDIEGPQGSFECLYQSQGQLEILGALPSKLRIHAKEDVYEHTRTKMHEAEKTQKEKSTREIKPNQTDIGRKLKVKHPFSLSNIPNSNVITNKRDLSQNNLSSNLNNNIILNNNTINNTISTTSATSGTAASLTSSSILKSSNQSNIMSGIVNSSNTQPQPQTTNSTSSANNCIGLSSTVSHNSNSSNNSTAPGVNNNINQLPLINGCIANGVTNPTRNSNNRSQNGNGKNDITKRSIKERLIHLLAVRPYKKPEVFARLTGEGIREREKTCISTVLKTISFLRDNTYHLHRHIWNDVHEDWPYYSEQEKQSLKRRKPQNLTPPLSSDGGSSTSGQSPTSTHNGSPPPAVKRPVLISEKPLEGPAPKKQRISHYKKEPVNHDSNRRGVTDSRDSSNMNPRSRENDEIAAVNNYFGSNNTPNAHESEDSGMSLSFSVLGSDVAKRIASAPISAEQDIDNNEDAMMETQSDNEKNSSRSNHDFDQFTRITTIEQRRKYKTEFDNDYAEYRKLYAEIDQTSKRFEQLGKKLRNEKNNQRYREIQRQIVSEYNQKMRDSHHQQAKSRFNYLHEKLSHIKRLVNEYDTTLKNKHITQQNY